MEEEETVTITKSTYERLLDDSMFLEALEVAGVDNWVGYGYACDLYNEIKEDE